VKNQDEYGSEKNYPHTASVGKRKQFFSFKNFTNANNLASSNRIGSKKEKFYSPKCADAIYESKREVKNAPISPKKKYS
jgi:hypothetical protein